MNKKTVALLLVATLVISLLSSAQASSYTVANVGVIRREDRLALGDAASLTLTTLNHQTAGVQEERYVELEPGSDIRAVVQGGSTVYGDIFTLNTLQQRMQSQGREMVAALNGGYFTHNTGVPDGILITDGVLRATDNYYRYIGFPASGGAFISSTPIYVTATAQIGGVNRDISISQVNHTRTADRLILFTPDFGANTHTSTAGVHVVLNVDGRLTVNGSVSGTVDSVITGAASCPLKAGQMVLSVADTGPKSRLDGLTAGTAVTIRVSCGDSRLTSCPFAIGANQKLLTGGQVVSGLAAGAAPRTAVGVKADGTCVFYTVDGRQSGYSEGLSLTELARRLLSLGCVEAVNLDGGGSTIMGARYPGQNQITVTGRPSDGAQRQVADYIVLLNETPRLNTAGRLFVYPFGVTLLKGATVSFTATATDLNYHPMSVPSLTWWTDDQFVGAIRSDGLFTALAAGECQAAATGGDVTGGVPVRVVDALDSLWIVNQKTGSTITSLSATPGERVELSARGSVGNLPPVTAQNSCFTWTVEGQIGAVSASGVFTATDKSGVNGNIYIEYNGKKVTLPVTVGRRPAAVETFEAGADHFGPLTKAIGLTIDNDSERAQYGLHAGRISYDFGQTTETAAVLPANVTLPAGSSWLSLWVSGDGSGHQLGLDVTNSSGAVTKLNLGSLNFTGYRQFQLALPSGASKISALRLTRSENGSNKGSFLTDQWVASPARYEGEARPLVYLDTVELSPDGDTVTVEARALSSDGLPLTAADVTLSWDGEAQKISYSTVTGRCKLTLPCSDNLSHRLTLEAVAPSGSRSRISHNVTGTANAGANPSVFGDVAGHWSEEFVGFLSAKGVLDKPTGGQTSFYPDRALNRADMAVYTARLLKLDLSKYDSVALPFSDTASIPKSALREVRALYALGIVKGKSDPGKLYYDPMAPITRAEFCTLLGRTLPRGFAASALSFSDNDKIAAYAKYHIEIMMSLSFIAGYPDGAMRPRGNITRAEAAKILYMYN